MTNRLPQQIIGLVLLFLGLAAAAAAWVGPLGGDPRIRPIIAAFFALAVLGGGMLILPSPRQERLGRFEDLWDMSALQMITARWWVVIAVALAVGGANYALVSGDWPGLRRNGEAPLFGAAPVTEQPRRAESGPAAGVEMNTVKPGR